MKWKTYTNVYTDYPEQKLAKVLNFRSLWGVKSRDTLLLQSVYIQRQCTVGSLLVAIRSVEHEAFC